MKRILSAIITASAVFAIVGCDPFTTSYERIDDSEFRLLDFIYEPADASPGDTVTLTAVFAGRRIDNMDKYLEWRLSFNVIRDMFGSQTVIDSIPLEKLIADGLASPPVDTAFSDSTQAVTFKFVIPNDIVKTSQSIQENWTDVLRTYTNITIPEQLASLTKSQIVDMIDSIDRISGYSEFIRNNTILPLPILLQLFTVPIRISAKIHESGKRPHTIISNQSVRYNRRFRNMYEDWTIPYNRNPVVDSVVVYKVKGNDRVMFNPKNDKAERAFLIYRSDNSVKDPVIEIEDGYSYFIEAASESRLDYTTTTTGIRAAEKHHAYWQFRLDPEETKNVSYSDYMDFLQMMGDLWSIVPPKDKRVKKFTFWVTVTDADETTNERMRPEGSTLVEVSGRFEYKAEASGWYQLQHDF
jgi:hypothetical protein